MLKLCSFAYCEISKSTMKIRFKVPHEKIILIKSSTNLRGNILDVISHVSFRLCEGNLVKLPAMLQSRPSM